MKEIELTSEGQKIKGVVFQPQTLKDKNPAILFVHGWTSSIKSNVQSAEALTQLGHICICVDLRGHGESEGDIQKMTREDFLKDVLAVYDYLVAMNSVDKDDISAVGSSFGSYMVALLSSKRKIKNLALRVPANYPNDSFNEPQILFSGNNDPSILQWRFQEMNKDSTYSLEAVNNFSGNVLIVESGQDELIPHQTIENYMNAVQDKAKLTHIVMKDASHSISRDQKSQLEYKQILINWFKNK
ncbi:hypothetical protein A3D80_03550 [Candidatus Roizmanbacteria bacterium RIFCSPHIGHO2_02_FULL_40_13b]|uniref:Peptidase S9 prolyl oligopeptidase catalytic domain-containing protein n=1 Tax=Candidatus Roizmanbacteria bacterium RIFCSPHIGHO2_01_FULL_39_24 TaxID=1802032 RepID=A0A1F7GKA2_9BACT|nr:MAG: hypothetical protein A2799_04260 [Candidatus Roizmanbacteria bacterium RIFCSPHIGHO2_01_FULL_39_24]OGK27041.1 MAG: hypothetical protein A3D80_03550 [Candidatus Roizmanbacteria bacterium RIFCSPHIGHO2_02_FULL_40_13b]OGK48803.1 MAG: hypothetical protein A3A56_01170 [Candidatus Roizmanbacteria bacterium RIFCSPLOWO2_01_FULL_40_32]